MWLYKFLAEEILLLGLKTLCILNGSLCAFTAALSAEQKQSLGIDSYTPAYVILPPEPLCKSSCSSVEDTTWSQVLVMTNWASSK